MKEKGKLFLSYKKLAFLITFSMLQFMLYGCSQKTAEFTRFSVQPENTKAIKGLVDFDEGTTISYGIINEKGYNETNVVYYLRNGDSFKRFINICNGLGFDCEFALLTFVNYIQTEYLMEENTVYIGNVNIRNKTDLFIPIELDTLKEGINDIIFVIVPEPNGSERSAEKRFLAYEPAYLRCTVIVGESSNQSLDQIEDIAGCSFAKGEMNGVYINDNEKAIQLYQLIEIKERDPLNFYITVDNLPTSERYKEEWNTCVLLLLRNLKQVTIADKPFIEVKVDCGNRIIIPYEESKPEPGYSEYLAIRINRPYKVIDSYEEIEDVNFSGFTGVKVLRDSNKK